MRKNKFICFCLIFIFVLSIFWFSYATEPETNEFVFDNTVRNHEMNAIAVPERDINL